jgi:hypothetical protein
MFAKRTLKALIVLAVCAMWAMGGSPTRDVFAEKTDVVDLEGDTHHNPPSAVPDSSTNPPSTTTNADTDTHSLGTPKKLGSGSTNSVGDREKLKLRAGEDARGQAQVLGMSLQETGHDRVKVTEVAMNSPAFDAGVMKGDEIVTFQGFRGETYRKWIDGIRRLTTDTAPGLKIPVILGRDGKQMTVQIEVPPRERAATTRPLAQPGSPLVQPGAAPQTNVAVVGGNNVAIGGSGPFVDFFGGEQAASPHDRAIAQLVRVGREPTPGQAKNASAGTPAPAPTAVPAKGGARVGMAGFRDDPSGMVVMVDVAGLPSGTYTVSIADPSVIGGAAVAGPNSATPNVTPPAQPTSPQAPPAGSGPRISPNGSVPLPAKPGQPQGSLQLKRSIEIPRTVLAQVAASPDPIRTSPPNPADANANPGTKPAVAPAAQTGPGTLSIGTLTVDLNGAGRLQQRVESARVRDVVGQGLIIYGQRNLPPTATPANADASAAPPTRPGLNGPISAGNYDQSLQGSGLQVPVAGGIIQLITDRRPPAGLAPQSTQAPGGVGGPVEQPASAPPPANQNLVR